MINPKVLTLLLVGGIGMESCEELSLPEFEQKYTIIWQNDNGEILEIDREVIEGVLPTYDGITPTKIGTDQYSYVFDGWDIQIDVVTENVSYTAVFIKIENKFTVTWENYDGTVLEIDNDVIFGTIPTYNGAIPRKESEEDEMFIFMGWTETVEPVKCDVTYTAKYIQARFDDSAAGVQPVVSSDGKTVQYGFYPQTNVKDTNLINILNTLSPTGMNGWYLYEGSYYVKEKATIYNNESYTFDNGTAIVNGTEYWYKCEPITWRILEGKNNAYYLMSSKLLDVQHFYKDYSTRNINNQIINPNNYEHSDIRTWLNYEFYNIAFAINNQFVVGTNLDNEIPTNDKVFLPSYEDCLKSNYGFDTNETIASKTRTALTTDYSRASGAWINVTKDLKNNGIYWTRTAGSFTYASWVVNSGGYLSSYAVDGNSHCVRPCIMVSL